MLTDERVNKYELLLAMQTLDFEIKQLTAFSKSCNECFVLIKERIEKLCCFMTNQEFEKRWQQYGDHEDVKAYAEQLRESSVRALCDMEKYDSFCICNNKLDINGYFSALSESVKQELVRYNIDDTSRVLFIGAGAFPLSSLTIARYSGAFVLGLDIDEEAVRMANNVAEVLKLKDKVRFSVEPVDRLPIVREATHIFIASLVERKDELLDMLKACMNPKAKIILRYGNGLKSVFNYPLEAKVKFKQDWVIEELPSFNALYDSLILMKQPFEQSMRDAVNL